MIYHELRANSNSKIAENRIVFPSPRRPSILTPFKFSQTCLAASGVTAIYTVDGPLVPDSGRVTCEYHIQKSKLARQRIVKARWVTAGRCAECGLDRKDTKFGNLKYGDLNYTSCKDCRAIIKEMNILSSRLQPQKEKKDNLVM
jgi:hypothetical protein